MASAFVVCAAGGNKSGIRRWVDDGREGSRPFIKVVSGPGGVVGSKWPGYAPLPAMMRWNRGSSEAWRGRRAECS
jgi:hypothetical protein